MRDPQWACAHSSHWLLITRVTPCASLCMLSIDTHTNAKSLYTKHTHTRTEACLSMKACAQLIPLAVNYTPCASLYLLIIDMHTHAHVYAQTNSRSPHTHTHTQTRIQAHTHTRTHFGVLISFFSGLTYSAQLISHLRLIIRLC